MARASFNSWWQEIGDRCTLSVSPSVGEGKCALLAGVLLLGTLGGCAGPDLVVDSLKYVPEEPRVGQTITLKAVVKNKGWWKPAGRSKLGVGVVRMLGGSDRGPMVLMESSIFAVPRLGPWQRHGVKFQVTLDRPGRYAAVAMADVYDNVPESREGNNMETLMLLVRDAVPPVLESCEGNAILPIGAADLGPGQITSAMKYDPPDQKGIYFAFKRDETNLRIQVFAPCAGTVTEVWPKREIPGDVTSPETGAVSVNIKAEGGLNMFLSFEPDNTAVVVNGVNQQRGAIGVNELDTVAQGHPIGELIIQNPTPGSLNPEWFPGVQWVVYRGTNTSSIDEDPTAVECPRDSLSSNEQNKLDQVFDRLEQERLAEGPPATDPSLLPVCP